MLSKDIKKVQTTRAWTGLVVVLIGDVGIALAAILVAWHVNQGPQAVAILTSAFTAMTAITAAYFGIRGATNAAQSAVEAVSGKDKPEGDDPKKGIQSP